ncbi:MAG: hypothetical protein QN120_05360 [Armatimonadota bacterium]|nr:hypothetical protein [Armatimonadota bacterium]
MKNALRLLLAALAALLLVSALPGPVPTGQAQWQQADPDWPGGG